MAAHKRFLSMIFILFAVGATIPVFASETAPAGAGRYDVSSGTSSESRVAAYVQRLCNEKKTYLESVRRQNLSVDSMINQVVYGSADIVFLGVEHYNFETKTYPAIAKAIKKKLPQLDCFFVEGALAPGTNEAATLAAFNRGDQSVEAEMNSLFGRDQTSRFKRLRELGLKVQFVDKPGADTITLTTESEVLEWLNDRDEYMARQTQNLLSSGTCRSILYPVGFDHMVQRRGRNNLKNRLQAANVKTNELLLLIAGRNSNDNPKDPNGRMNSSWNWLKAPVMTDSLQSSQLLCKHNAAIPERLIAFANGASRVPVGYLSKSNTFFGTFGEFQGSIIYSCSSDPKCRTVNQSFDGNARENGLEIY